MTQKQKMIFNFALLLWSYGYCVNGYTKAALLVGAFTVFTVFWSHSIGCATRHLILILTMTISQLLLSEIFGLSYIFPSLGFLILCNNIFAVVWMQSSRKAIQEVMHLFLKMFLVFIVLALVVPGATGGLFNTRLQLLVFVLLIFTPSGIVYLTKGYWKATIIQWKKRRNLATSDDPVTTIRL